MKGLERSLGIVPVVAISLSAMLGSGVFILPGLVYGIIGPLGWLAYLIAAICVFPAAASKSELATAMPTSGGTFVYIDRIFGPLVGTITGLALWVSTLLKAAFALLGVGTYLAVVWEVPVVEVALVLTVGMVVINWVGVSAVSRAQVLIMVIACVFLGALIFLSPIHFQPVSILDAGPDSSYLGLIGAAGFVVVAYNGVTKIAAIAEEVKNPERTVPWGIFLSLLIATTIYVTVSAFLAKTLAPTALSGDLRPIATWGGVVADSWGLRIGGLIGAVALLSLANAGILAASRFPFAMARDQLLPPVFEQISPRFQTPGFSILMTGLMMSVAIVLLDVAALAKLASAIVITLYIANNLAVLVFREVGVGWYRPKFKSPFYPWVQLFGVVSGLGLLVLLGSVALKAILLTALAGAVIFFAYGRKRVTRRGIWLQRGRRKELVDREADTDSHLTSFADENTEPSGVFPPFSLGPNRANSRDSRPLGGRARSVVAMFGDERAPETLAEIGSALSGSQRVPVIHLTEVPEQTILGAIAEAPQLLSLRRRLSSMSEEEGTELEFHALASRDIAGSVQAITSEVNCDYLVMSWRGRSKWALSPYNPLGWMLDHLSCNVAVFRDMGVRYIREILVYPEPGPHDALVVTTADDLAARWGARLTLVRPLVGEKAESKREKEREYLRELSALCESPSRTKILVGKDSVEALVRASSAYDLLVMASPKTPLYVRVLGTETDRITRRAACSVLTLKTARSRTHEAVGRRKASDPASVIQLFTTSAALAQIDVSRKEALFEFIGSRFATEMNCEPKVIVNALWARERTQNTSVGHGVALPHASLDSAPKTLVAALTSAEPIDYHGPDGQAVDVFFVILSPPSERQLHLNLLSTIAKLSLTTNLLDDMRAATSSEEVLTALKRAEQSTQAPAVSAPAYKPDGLDD